MISSDDLRAGVRKSAGVAASYGSLLLLGSLLVLPWRLEATSIVALIDHSNDRVVIAADCRVNQTHGAAEKCKIVEEPDCVVAMAGLFEEPAAGFHLGQLVHAACLQAGGLRDKAEAFLKISKGPYENAARSIRGEQPDNFAQTIANKATEVIFAGLEKGRLALIVRGLVADATGKVSLERSESTAPSYARVGYFLGLNGHIRAHLKSHPDWAKGDYVQLARRFVEIEVEAHPDLAGPPISELEIDEEGHVHWLDKGACNGGEPDGTTRETIGN